MTEPKRTTTDTTEDRAAHTTAVSGTAEVCGTAPTGEVGGSTGSTGPDGHRTWTGSWVADRLGVELTGDEHEQLTSMLGLALRRNPKRAHLLVSNVLGKHVPQSPRVVWQAGYDLGLRVRELLGTAEATRSVVLGYAETATGLGHSVADGLALAPCLHSTRRPVEGVDQAGGFEESHSHATSHLLLPEDPALLRGDGPLVLVDDEFSTGNTVLNTIRALHASFPRKRYVIVALVDMRSAADQGRLAEFADEIGACVDLIAAATGTVRLPADVLEKGQDLVARYEAAAAPSGAALTGATPSSSLRAASGSVFEPAPGAAPEPASADTPPVPPTAPTVVHAGPELHSEAETSAVPGPRNGVALSPGPGAAPRRNPETQDTAPVFGTPPAAVARVDLGWPTGLPDGGRHGFTPRDRERLEQALPLMAACLAQKLGFPATADTSPLNAPSSRPRSDGHRPRVLVLGFEELMYAPLRLGVALEDTIDADVRYSTTTRSPVLAVDDPGYAIRSRLVFPAHDRPADGPGPRYAYNVAGAGFDAIVAVVDSTADTPELHAPDGLLAQLAAHTPHVLLVNLPSYTPSRHHISPGATSSPAASCAGASTTDRNTERQEPSMLPEPLRGPAFSSYAPDEVGWLLQDLSDAELEAPTEEREEAIQSGGAHYAESLPVEFQPSPDYQALFTSALDQSASRIATAVGTVTDTVLTELAQRSGKSETRPVLVSLARAGTPVGVLMRRWAQHRHGIELPHFAVSIVRGRGIDTNALRWLAAHYDPADVVFVDGWTGKGAITRELAQALERFEKSSGITGFSPEIAVLADPGSCVRTYGTREDYLIPSACLNSTVSGLISRTVLRGDLVGPDDFHGAKFYRELSGSDVSTEFLAAVQARFDEVSDVVEAQVKEMLAVDRAPTWEGWAAVERISEAYGIHDVNLVKPGVGETTRVLLRRVPWKILARRGAGPDLDHLRLLADQRGVPIEEVDHLPYSCVGLIHPKYTRGATGADGKAVTAS